MTWCAIEWNLKRKSCYWHLLCTCIFILLWKSMCVVPWVSWIYNYMCLLSPGPPALLPRAMSVWMQFLLLEVDSHWHSGCSLGRKTEDQKAARVGGRLEAGIWRKWLKLFFRKPPQDHHKHFTKVHENCGHEPVDCLPLFHFPPPSAFPWPHFSFSVGLLLREPAFRSRLEHNTWQDVKREAICSRRSCKAEPHPEILAHRSQGLWVWSSGQVVCWSCGTLPSTSWSFSSPGAKTVHDLIFTDRNHKWNSQAREVWFHHFSRPSYGIAWTGPVRQSNPKW